MNNKIITIIVVVIAIILGVVWYGQKDSKVNPTSGEPIKVGVVYGLTGAASSWTESGKRALDLAVEEINANGGINGRPLELVYENSETNPAKSVSAFQKLVATEGVVAVIGDVWSFITNPLIPLAEQSQVVLISPTVMDRSVEVESPYFFTMGHTVESQRQAAEKFFEVNPEIKTASILYWEDAWGLAHRELFREVAATKGVEILSEESTADFSSTYRSEMTKVKATGADALLIATSLPVPVFKSYSDLGLTQKVLATTIVVDGIEAQDMPRAYAKNVWFMDWQPNQEFVDKFEERYGVFPILEAQNHYEVLRSIALGLKNNEANLLAGLKMVNYESVDGEVDFVNNSNIAINEAEARLYTVNLDEGYTLIE